MSEAVTFSSTNMLEAYRGIRPIVTALSFLFASAERSACNALPDAKKLRLQGVSTNV